MKIEFEETDGEVEVIDAIIRDYPVPPEDEGFEETFFQARLNCNDLNEYDSIAFSVSYYSVDCEFIGLDSGSIWVSDIMLKNPYSISFVVNPPKNTALAKCRIGIRKCKKSLWDYSWPTFLTLVYALLLSAIIKVWL